MVLAKSDAVSKQRLQDVARLASEAAATAADVHRLAADAEVARVAEEAQVSKDKAKAHAEAARQAAVARADARLRHMRSLLPETPPEMSALPVDPAVPLMDDRVLQQQLTECLQGVMCDDSDRQFKVSTPSLPLLVVCLTAVVWGGGGGGGVPSATTCMSLYRWRGMLCSLLALHWSRA